MKLVIWLRNIFSTAYYLTIIILMVVLGLMIFAIVADSEMVREFVDRSPNLIVKSKSALFAALSFTFISGAFWIYILRLLRNLTWNLSIRDLFSDIKYPLSSYQDS
ncbi:hypothetical protein [Christiangramia sp. OXR-203]|uniref:hypothetical protein n=1 Tax=Christiangramia sp. OXR-203 TaxID=3100176 RepID=UPI002AC8D5A9|nr:hypothetical protein [Christiangramia sp. OXR-203]WPY98478.1 hypothetical protein T8I65_15030 [Christiangramia sp. OXR-203]